MGFMLRLEAIALRLEAIASSIQWFLLFIEQLKVMNQAGTGT